MSDRVFYKEEVEVLRHLIIQVLTELGIDHTKPEWIDKHETKSMLGISSDTTLWSLRKDPASGIIFSQKNKKNIMYLRSSVLEYLKQNAKES